MSNRVNQQGRGRTTMGVHRGRPLTPLGARFHIVPPGWGGGRRLGASAASSVGSTAAFGTFLPTLARRSQRCPRAFC